MYTFLNILFLFYLNEFCLNETIKMKKNYTQFNGKMLMMNAYVKVNLDIR